LDRQELYEAVGIQRLQDLYTVALGGEKGEIQVAGSGINEFYVVTQWGLIQVFVAPARQGVKGVARVARAVQTTRSVARRTRPAAKTTTKAAPKKFDMYAEKYYRLSPSKRFTARRKDLYESSSPMERELLQTMWALEAQSSNFNPTPWILAMFGGSAYVIAWAWLVGHRL
jgi:hypothetical protein